MFSAKGFSPAQSGLLAKQNALHLQKSRMMHFAGHQFVGMKKLACVNGVEMFGGPKVVCQALEDKSKGVPELDLEEIQRQMERNQENRLLAIRFAVASAEKRLQDAKEAFEAAKGNENTAGDQELLKKVEECDSDTKEDLDAAKGNKNAAGGQELLKKKVEECDRDAKKAFEESKGNENAAGDQKLLKKNVKECDSDTKEAFEAAKGKESAAGDQKILKKKKVEECDSDNKEAFEAAKGNENSAGDLELLKKKVGECENDVLALKTWYRIEGGKEII